MANFFYKGQIVNTFVFTELLVSASVYTTHLHVYNAEAAKDNMQKNGELDLATILVG